MAKTNGSDVIQVLELTLENGEKARFTGIQNIGNLQVIGIRAYQIAQPREMVANALAVTEKVYKTISRAKMTDDQRKELLAKAMEELIDGVEYE